MSRDDDVVRFASVEGNHAVNATRLPQLVLSSTPTVVTRPAAPDPR
jgi:hypothetical protein